ncbi:paired mesoderm homeobox protein 1 [Platysternon megacephalum]|uniref:Paired mesoderm homeobox protein 1 n=1 Tax=Platysternon megacephalum TaxID=55544 RepID=A0A4D9E1M9_9SAUR|nr:paired mesoderm homeobox protein 1 [Platysternon megacephalum]
MPLPGQACTRPGLFPLPRPVKDVLIPYPHWARLAPAACPPAGAKRVLALVLVPGARSLSPPQPPPASPRHALPCPVPVTTRPGASSIQTNTLGPFCLGGKQFPPRK